MLKRLLAAGLFALCSFGVIGAEKPNILWIVGEDLGPEIGAYGDSYARTPNIDRLASEGVLYKRAFTHAPVCAPSRSGLITGRYPTSIGTHHMRSKLLNPPPMFTRYLKDAGYVIAWPGKTDFNFDLPPGSFDITNPNWLNNPPKQPFFGYINLGLSHESQIRSAPQALERNLRELKAGERHDPLKAPLPPYYPDTPEIRRDMAKYYDLGTAVDYRVGHILEQLERTGLSSNTVVFFFGDHGRGLPRGKRWVYDSGIHVPLIIRWPGKLKPGTKNEQLVSFVDFAPTVLEIAGVTAPKELDGKAFLGPRATERPYVFAARDRMDETYDRIRAVRDNRYKYVRNLHPELPYAQRVEYGEEMPTMQVWRKLNSEGKLTGAQKVFFAARKPAEELYDTQSDPHEINNLVNDAKLATKLTELRGALDTWLKETGDLGAIPEKELVARGLVANKLAEYEPRVERGRAEPK